MNNSIIEIYLFCVTPLAIPLGGSTAYISDGGPSIYDTPTLWGSTYLVLIL